METFYDILKYPAHAPPPPGTQFGRKVAFPIQPDGFRENERFGRVLEVSVPYLALPPVFELRLLAL